LKKGSPHYPSFKMNLFRATIHPVSFWTSLMQVGAFVLLMAKIYLALASILRWLMMKLSSFSDGTPKMHLLGLSFHLYSRRDVKVSSRSTMRVLEFLVLTITSST
jgi:hypothetical protein